MKLRDLCPAWLRRTRMAARLWTDSRYRTVARAVVSLIGNLAFAFYHGIWGAMTSSVIFGASAAYYLLLTLMRFFTVLFETAGDGRNVGRGRVAVGGMLMLLGLSYPWMILLSIRHGTATAYGTIPMIAIATFTFAKITVAAVAAGRHRREASPMLRAIRRIRYGEIAVTVLTMQQSMLVSFGEGDDPSSVVLNACTGAGVCVFILILGILTLKKEKSMATSKITKATETVAKKTTDAYHKVEEAVVSGYRKVEDAVVGGYTKIEDGFVARYLAREGETVAQAKERLKRKEGE